MQITKPQRRILQPIHGTILIRRIVPGQDRHFMPSGQLFGKACQHPLHTAECKY